ncbi:MAG TPA: sugar phosphate isomerase/epimerase family protein [Saprospiraceae bacterium]|nr:sugar phosphate isomerase/epimerase family protein [Saprospiraceae bacterium]HMQ85003.1 sugar phosphate isomerase/epimerase family protein [Saprospiraceae bacterium]
MNQDRRLFIKQTGLIAAGFSLYGLSACGNQGAADKSQEAEQGADSASNLFFKISLAQWSLHRTLFAGELDNLDFAAKAKNEFGIDAVEYVNQFFRNEAENKTYLSEMKKRAEDNGVKSLLIMIDGEGNLGDTDEQARQTAVQNHLKWLNAAQFLGCHSIRVNAGGEGTPEAVAEGATKSLSALGDYAAPMGLNVIVENHGGYSSNGEWLSGIMKNVNKPNVGTLPDFGNFCMTYGEAGCLEEYDRYKGVEELMPFAKAVSAKSNVFDQQGMEMNIDYVRMLNLVKNAGYTGYIGIEYEGSKLSEAEGIKATKKLLEVAGASLM